MPFEGYEPHRQRPATGPVDSKHGLTIGRCVVEAGVGIKAQCPPVIDQAAAFRVEGQHLTERAEG
jgi:hypothetical protein